MENAGLVSPPASSTLPTAPPKDPITCHVLDQTTGLPARALSVSLTLLRPLGPSNPLKAATDKDGRITKWQAQEGPSLQEMLDNLDEHPGSRMVWVLKFDTGAYFGEGNTFFPEVEVRFYVSPNQGHYHVPLLLGPWSYTTYRGS